MRSTSRANWTSTAALSRSGSQRSKIAWPATPIGDAAPWATNSASCRVAGCNRQGKSGTTIALRLAQDHVQLVVHQHRVDDRMRHEQRQARGQQLAKLIGSRFLIGRAGHEHGVGRGGMQQFFPVGLSGSRPELSANSRPPFGRHVADERDFVHGRHEPPPLRSPKSRRRCRAEPASSKSNVPCENRHPG